MSDGKSDMGQLTVDQHVKGGYWRGDESNSRFARDFLIPAIQKSHLSTTIHLPNSSTAHTHRASLYHPTDRTHSRQLAKMDFSQFNGTEQAHMTRVIEKKQVSSGRSVPRRRSQRGQSMCQERRALRRSEAEQ